jgi:hypothetical protein
MRVRLVVPARATDLSAKQHGEHLAYHGQSGEIIAGAPPDGAWVRFDGQQTHQYVGCPVAWLEPA